MAEQEQNRSEAATPFKLTEARKRGQVAKSQDVNMLAILAMFVLALLAIGAALVRDELHLMHAVLAQADRSDWSEAGTLAWLAALGGQAFRLLAPLLVALAIAAILANFLQVGPIFSTHPLKPDFERLNPVAGLKRLFSLRLLYEAARSVLKLSVIACVLWLALTDLLPLLLHLLRMAPLGQGVLVMGALAPLLFKLLLACLLFAVLDTVYGRWDFARRMRMSKREVVDEHKQREGDPRIRARLRQLRIEMLKQSRAVGALPQADVLLTNPTHLAVAISYKHGDMPAPKVLAKGAGELAAKMRAAAHRHGVAVVENRALARELYRRVPADQFVPEDLYPLLARILLWVYARRDGRGAGSAV
ncbi:MAG: hypothetical protein K0R43_435 [Pseudoduganella sp.]|jgi:flagellar biosynthesis protein FlhB|nr:hypothetical protein [Pseudoduganella sp.]